MENKKDCCCIGIINIFLYIIGVIFYFCEFYNVSLWFIGISILYSAILIVYNVYQYRKNKVKLEVSNILWGIFILLGVIFSINCAYLIGTPTGESNTAFSAGETLGFYGSFLSFIGTISLGYVAYEQNKKANKKMIEMQEKLLLSEQTGSKPQFVMLEPQFAIDTSINNNGFCFSTTLNKKNDNGLVKCIGHCDFEIVLLNIGNEIAHDVNHTKQFYRTGEESVILQYPVTYQDVVKTGEEYKIKVNFNTLLSIAEQKTKGKYKKQMNIYYRNSYNICFKQEIMFDVDVDENTFMVDIHKIGKQEIQEEK